MIAVDILLLLGLTLRLSRLVTSDHLGEWFVQEPAEKWAGEPQVDYVDGDFVEEPENWKQKIVKGLSCAFCEGYWVGIFTLLSLYLVGGPGDAAEWWRWLAGAFALNYVVGHASARLD